MLPQAMASGEHPQRHHRREIEGRDADADAQRVPSSVSQSTLAGQVLEGLPHQQAGNAAGEFDISMPRWTSAAGLGDGLAVLAGHQRRQLLEACSHQLAKAKQDARPFDRRRLAPGGQRGGGAAHPRSISAAVQKGTCACTLPVHGLKTSPRRSPAELSQRPPIKKGTVADMARTSELC